MEYSKFAVEAANRVGWWWLEKDKYVESNSARKENEEMVAPNYSKSAEEAANKVGWWWLEEEKYAESDSSRKENEEVDAPNYSKSAEEAANKVGWWWLEEEKTNECAEKGNEQMKEGFSMKNAGAFPDMEVPYENSSRVETRGPQQQLLDSSNPELLPTKKSAIEGSDGRPVPGVPNVNLSWETPSFQAVQSCTGNFADRLFESVPPSAIDSGYADTERRGVEDQYGTNASVALSLLHNLEDPGSCLTYGGIRKVRVNRVEDSGNGLPMQSENAFRRRDCNSFSLNGFQEAPETEPQHCALNQFNHSFNEFQDACKASMNSGRMNNIKDVGKIMSMQLGNSCSIGNSNRNSVSFNGFPVEAAMINYDMVMRQFSIQDSQLPIQHSEVLKEKVVVDTVSTDLVVNVTPVPAVSGVTPKPKNGLKESKTVIPNSFPSNVRCLLSTGILDGIPVKYVVGKDKELRGIIKSSGYLCGCDSCNYAKVLNAYEFEKHAGTKSKHPNNHIYFGNGKTVYAIAQELKATPPKMLFNAIENCTGYPINQKNFAIWKESYMVASRELERIYGKDLLKLSTQS